MDEVGGLLKPYDIVNVPVSQVICSSCGGALFVTVNTFFADTGELMESGLHVACADCDAAVDEPTRKLVTQWMMKNFRVDVASEPQKKGRNG